MQCRAERPGRAGRIFLRLVRDDDDAPGAFGRHLRRDHRHAQAPVHRLAAGHGDGVVEEDLVGDVDLGRRRRADGEDAGMIVGAVADILEDVGARRERRLADPVRALGAHLRVAVGPPVHILRHVMAADAGIGARALRHMGRGGVRTAGAKVGRARRRRAARGKRRLRLPEAGKTRHQPLVRHARRDP